MAEQEKSCETCGRKDCGQDVKARCLNVLLVMPPIPEYYYWQPKEQEKSYEGKKNELCRNCITLLCEANHPEGANVCNDWIKKFEQLALAEGERRATERIVKILHDSASEALKAIEENK